MLTKILAVGLICICLINLGMLCIHALLSQCLNEFFYVLCKSRIFLLPKTSKTFHLKKGTVYNLWVLLEVNKYSKFIIWS